MSPRLCQPQQASPRVTWGGTGCCGSLASQGSRGGRNISLFEQPLKPCKGAIKAGRTVGVVRGCLLCKGVTQTSVFKQKCASQIDGVRLSPLC